MEFLFSHFLLNSSDFNMIYSEHLLVVNLITFNKLFKLNKLHVYTVTLKMFHVSFFKSKNELEWLIIKHTVLIQNSDWMRLV